MRYATCTKIAAVLFAIMSVMPAAAEEKADSTKTSWFKRFWENFIRGNEDKTFEKKFDVSFAIYPSYTREGSFGIGGMATGMYRLDKQDSTMQPSDVSLIGNVSIKGFYTLQVKGNNNFKGNRNRIAYNLVFLHKNLDFWGISFEDCASNPVSAYTRQQLKFDCDYSYKILPGFFAGASLLINYADASNMTAPEYLSGENSSYYFTGLGISLQYDTRDMIVNPKKGFNILAKEVFYPSFLGNFGQPVFCTTVLFNAYCPLWKGCTFASDLYGQFNSHNAPWSLREELGSGNSRMRGYYSGRYIDRCYISAQIELRQYIYWRLGCVVWGGAGAVFPSFAEFNPKAIMPNWGLGLRFEFKHNMNLRVDYGFGKGTSGFVIQFAEAF